MEKDHTLYPLNVSFNDSGITVDVDNDFVEQRNIIQLTRVSVFGKFELLNKGEVDMKIYVIVKETQTTVGGDSYWSHENVEAFSSKQDAEFELKYTYKVDCFQSDVHFSIEEMELN